MRQYAPRIQVMLYEVFSGGGSYDITERLGDGCAIRTSKGIKEPFGTFTVSFVDRVFGDNDSLYARIAPMDAIEVRAAHDGSQNLKVLIRGFVSSIRREESIGGGTPSRRVLVTCQDVGKLWMTTMLHFLWYPQEQAQLLTGYGLYVKYLGASPKNMHGTEFLSKIVGILDDQLRTMLSGSALGMSLAAAGEGTGVVPCNAYMLTTDTSFYAFLSQQLDRGAWYELWMDDVGYGDVQVRWRELWSGPDSGITLTLDDLQSIIVWRDDSRVSNWYWASPLGGAMLDQLNQMIEAERVGFAVQDGRTYTQSAEKFFGWRKLEVRFSLMPPGWATNASAPFKDQYLQGQPQMTDWIADRTAALKRLNQDNVRLESAVVRCAGNENLRPGTWVTLMKATIPFRYYVTKVEHEITLWASFVTVLSLERGEDISGRAVYRNELDLKGVAK